MSAKLDATEIQNYIINHWPTEKVLAPGGMGEDSDPIYIYAQKDYAGYQAFLNKSFSSPTEIKNYLSDLNNSGITKIDNKISVSVQNKLKGYYTSGAAQFIDAPLPSYNPANVAQVDAPHTAATPAKPAAIPNEFSGFTVDQLAKAGLNPDGSKMNEQQKFNYWAIQDDDEDGTNNGTELAEGIAKNNKSVISKGNIVPQAASAAATILEPVTEMTELEGVSMTQKVKDQITLEKKAGNTDSIQNLANWFNGGKPHSDAAVEYANTPEGREDRIAQIVGDPNLGWNIKSKVIQEIQAGNHDSSQNLVNWFNGGKAHSAAASALSSTAQGKLDLANALPVGVKNLVIDEINAGNPDTVGNLVDWFGAGNPPSTKQERLVWAAGNTSPPESIAAFINGGVVSGPSYSIPAPVSPSAIPVVPATAPIPSISQYSQSVQDQTAAQIAGGNTSPPESIAAFINGGFVSAAPSVASMASSTGNPINGGISGSESGGIVAWPPGPSYTP